MARTESSWSMAREQRTGAVDPLIPMIALAYRCRGDGSSHIAAVANKPPRTKATSP